jgi:gamma-glutamylcyclotransferase (GGCT)/AIG2-like uncharacterized protein YtfP
MGEECKVFVYGTLKVGGYFSSNVSDLLLNHKPASINAIMYSIDDSYPGIIEGGNSKVKGEVHTFSDKKEALRRMDRIEGYYKEGDANNLYNRVKTTVETEDGDEEVYTYVFARSIGNYKPIKTGIWKI